LLRVTAKLREKKQKAKSDGRFRRNCHLWPHLGGDAPTRDVWREIWVSSIMRNVVTHSAMFLFISAPHFSVDVSVRHFIYRAVLPPKTWASIW
jgi:hypothetical protein